MDLIHLPLGLRIQAGNYYRTNLSFSLLFDQLYFILYSSRFRTSCMSLWEGTGNPNWGIGFCHTPNTPENPMQDYGKETEELTYSSRIFNIFCNFHSRGLQHWVCIFFYRCTLHSDIHTVHLPRDAHLLTLWIIYIKLDGSYMFRSTTIIRELAIEPG